MEEKEHINAVIYPPIPGRGIVYYRVWGPEGGYLRIFTDDEEWLALIKMKYGSIITAEEMANEGATLSPMFRPTQRGYKL